MFVNLDLFTTFGFYLTVLAGLYLYLSFRVVTIRARKHISLGHNNDPLLRRAVRAHANFAEYVPLAVLMILVISQITAPIILEKIHPMSLMTHLLFFSLILGRFCHAYGILFQEAQKKPSFFMRQLGSILTFAVIGFSGLILALNWIYSLAIS